MASQRAGGAGQQEHACRGLHSLSCVGVASIGVLVSSFCSRNVASRLGSVAALSGAALSVKMRPIAAVSRLRSVRVSDGLR